MVGCRVPESHLSDGLENVLGATRNLEREHNERDTADTCLPALGTGLPWWPRICLQSGRLGVDPERGIGRKVRGPQTGEIGCTCQMFLYLSLQQQEETLQVSIFFLFSVQN